MPIVAARYPKQSKIAYIPAQLPRILKRQSITPKDANTLAQRLRRKVSEIVTDATPMTITISIGISRFDTAELFESGLENYDQLLKEADEALYHAKRAGRNCVAYYSHQASRYLILAQTVAEVRIFCACSFLK